LWERYLHRLLGLPHEDSEAAPGGDEEDAASVPSTRSAERGGRRFRPADRDDQAAAGDADARKAFDQMRDEHRLARRRAVLGQSALIAAGEEPEAKFERFVGGNRPRNRRRWSPRNAGGCSPA
jgi:hypothetical protein